jgi:hypothetical protein
MTFVKHLSRFLMDKPDLDKRCQAVYTSGMNNGVHCFQESDYIVRNDGLITVEFIDMGALAA